jgi:cobalt-zinc-cadmium efflux system protein
MQHHHQHHEVNGKNLFITIMLNIFITLAQIIGGIFSGSLALLSDAMHNFSDVIALVIAYIANRLKAKPHTNTKTFGYERAEILATFINASTLIIIAFVLIIDSIVKFIYPENIESQWLIWLGLLSIVLNALSVFLIQKDAKKNLNMKTAYLHLLSDVMTSIAVVFGGMMICFYQLFWIDTLLCVAIAIYLIKTSFGVLRESFFILMQFVPENINIQEVANFITQTKEIRNVHHLHIWQLDEHHIHLETHLDFFENITLQESQEIIETLEKTLYTYFQITHTNFQCEYNRHGNKNLVQ